MTKINISIDRIVLDRPGLDRGAVEQALRAELTRAVATDGAGAFGAGGSRSQVGAALTPGAGPLSARIAAAAVKAVKP